MQTKNFNVYNEENKAVQEAYSLLMANVHFRNVKDTIKTVTLTSCNPEVGKTTIAINLAISMARSGWKTLLVDADIRKPGSVKRLSNEVMLGISDIMDEKISVSDVMCNTNIQNLFYLSCGKNNNNPIELLCSARFEKLVMEVREQYDFIIFDTPSLSSVIDGALVASKTDATLLVAQMGTTTLTSLKRSKEQLKKANTNILGVILNKVKKRDYLKYVESYDYFFDIEQFEKKKKSKAVEHVGNNQIQV
jgi:protein-tyrosine kinase